MLATPPMCMRMRMQSTPMRAAYARRSAPLYPPPPQPQPPHRPPNPPKPSNARRRARDHEESVDAYSHAIGLTPADPVLYANRAAAFIRLRRWADALADANRALALDARGVKALLRRAEALRQLGRLGEALQVRGWGGGGWVGAGRGWRLLVGWLCGLCAERGALLLCV